MAGGAVVALSLLCGVVGLFVASGASGKIEALQQSVDALQTKLATLQVSGDPRVGQLQAEQAGLSSRIDELSMKMDTQAASPAKGSDAQLSELRKRLDALEQAGNLMMHAAILVRPGVIELRKVEIPKASPGEMLVRIKAALTCGTDLKAFRRGHPVIPIARSVRA